jgi:hypothetical protein
MANKAKRKKDETDGFICDEAFAVIQRRAVAEIYIPCLLLAACER